MMKNSLAFCLCLWITGSLHAQVRLPRIIRDSMVLQRDTEIKIWGWASKREKVNIRFNEKSYRTRADDDGRWQVNLSPMKAGGPYTMVISGRNKIILHDILMGDVWLCAGQSNMEHQMKLHAVTYAGEIRVADYPEIRQFKVPNQTNLNEPQSDLTGGSWKAADSLSITDFSAVAFFFAKTLYLRYHVPLGIINVSWGGIPIEAIMSEESLKDFPAVKGIIEKNKDTAYVSATNRKAWAEVHAIRYPEDRGLAGRWYDSSYIPAGWKTMAIPGYWQDQGAKDLNGIVWYRKEIDVPASMINKPAKIFLGRIVDADELYVNGRKVGSTGYLYPQRRYPLPGGILKEGKNLLVIRVTNFSGKGGFVPDKPYQLIAGGDTVNLAGYWLYKAGMNFDPKNFPTPAPAIAVQNQPTAVYNAMLSPVIPYSIKGFLWYQGESNTGHPDEYGKLQPLMISDWRKKWNQGELPFLFVQLPGFGDYHYLPVESSWALFREAQAKSLKLSQTGMAVAIDIGEWNDVHPDRKKEVGQRLALLAEKIAYRENILSSGPVYLSSSIQGNKIIVSFSNTGAGLKTSDQEPPAEFAIAGADKKFVWAQTKIDLDKVIVWSDEISDPKYIRYAWADDPVNPNLYNSEDFPASPFRTDE